MFQDNKCDIMNEISNGLMALCGGYACVSPTPPCCSGDYNGDCGLLFE